MQSLNTGHPYANTGRDLVDALAGQGFRHDFQLGQARQRTGRWILEVYPHPAMVRLFRLERIIKYKKGTVAQKRGVLRVPRVALLAVGRGAQPAVRDARRGLYRGAAASRSIAPINQG